jgi:uncharacterized protein YxeA
MKKMHKILTIILLLTAIAAVYYYYNEEQKSIESVKIQNLTKEFNKATNDVSNEASNDTKTITDNPETNTVINNVNPAAHPEDVKTAEKEAKNDTNTSIEFEENPAHQEEEADVAEAVLVVAGEAA